MVGSYFDCLSERGSACSGAFGAFVLVLPGSATVRGVAEGQPVDVDLDLDGRDALGHFLCLLRVIPQESVAIREIALIMPLGAGWNHHKTNPLPERPPISPDRLPNRRRIGLVLT